VWEALRALQAHPVWKALADLRALGEIPPLVVQWGRRVRCNRTCLHARHRPQLPLDAS
jgi:hypothetical protein